MDAASILLVLAAAGQTSWTPDRYAAAPPPAATAPADERYGPPPAQAADQGFEAWQQDASQQIRSASNSLRAAGERTASSVNSHLQQVTNPFATTTTATLAPATTNRTRGSIAPPPWDSTASELEAAWSFDGEHEDATIDHTRSPGMVPTRTNSGWTSIGLDVAAPPLIAPQFVAGSGANSAAAPAPTQAAAGQSGPTFPTATIARDQVQNVAAQSQRQPPPPADGVNNWSNGWEDFRSAQATIGRANDAQPTDNTTRMNESPPRLAASAQPAPQQASQPSQPAGTWRDLWNDQPGSEQQPQNSSIAAPASQQAPQPAQTGSNVLVLGNGPTPPTQPAAAAPVTITAGSPPAPAGISFPAVVATDPAPLITQAPVTIPAAANSQPAQPAGEQQPWLPLLAASLALAGSVGANLFLGWSYLDARQKYQSLARKTADKFRRVSAAA